MSRIADAITQGWSKLDMKWLPFADAATKELPLGRLIRLSMFQVTVGMAIVLLIGTLNRVMIVELGVPAWVVALMLSLPLVFAPFRALVGFRSDTHRSVLGWRRVPFLWFGTMLQFGGFAIMPFALLILSGDTHGPIIIGDIAAALAFLLVGAGLHTTQTVGLALATDLAPEHARPKVVALLCVMLLVGMFASALIFGLILTKFSEIKLVQVVQGAGFVTMALNLVALWKQEARDPSLATRPAEAPQFGQAWRLLSGDGMAVRRMVAIGLGTVGFSMQDVLLEPYGGQILHLTVSATTALTALLAVGGILGLALAARVLGRGADPYRIAGYGAPAGVFAFSSVLFSAPLDSPLLFGLGTTLIGFGGGMFAHGTLTAAMGLAQGGQTGIALGAWGAVQASAAGCAVALGGLIRDGVSALAAHGALGEILTSPATGYNAVYQLEILVLFATLVAIGPLVRSKPTERSPSPSRLSLADLPG